MDSTPLVTRLIPSPPYSYLKKFVPHIDLHRMILIGIISLLSLSGFTTKHILPISSPISSSQHINTWLPYDGAPPNASPFPQPSPRLQWKTLYAFKAVGSKKTYPFSVPQNWRLLWSCGNTEQTFYSLTIAVNAPDGSSIDPVAVLTQCQQTITSNTVEEHKGGTVYLNIDSDSGWTIQVQAPTSTSTKIPTSQWKTQQTLRSNGNEKTSAFTVPNHWQITWQCTLVEKNDIDVLFADLDKTNGSVADPGAINGICKNGNTTDWTQEYMAGTYILNVSSNTSWTIQIQIPQ